VKPSTRATISAAAAVLLAVGGLYGPRYTALAVATLIVIVSIGWPSVARIPHPRVGAGIMMASGGIAVFAVALGEGEPYLRYGVAAAAAAVLLGLTTEVAFPSPPGRAVASVAAMSSGGLVAVSGAAWLAAARTPGANDLVVAAAVCLAVAAVFSSLTGRANVNGWLALVMASGTGLLMGMVFPTLTVVGGVIIGVTAAVSVVLIAEIARREPQPRTVWAGISAAVIPIVLAGALVYFGGRLLVG